MITPSIPTPDQQKVSIRLAEFIAERHERILAEWEDAVGRDQTIPAPDKLSHEQLRDHTPQILSGLSQMLCNAFNPQLMFDTAYEAATHGHMRWEERYDVSQVLRELSHLRVTLIYHVAEFQEQTPDFTGSLSLFAMLIVHSYFDRLMRISVESFIAAAGRKSKG
jgi:RsbRD-like negative regulator of sigma factor